MPTGITIFEFIFKQSIKSWGYCLGAAAPRQYPQDLIDCLNINSKIVIPVGNAKSQQLHVITKLDAEEIKEDIFEEVAFVPMLSGTSIDGNDSWVKGWGLLFQVFLLV